MDRRNLAVKVLSIALIILIPLSLGISEKFAFAETTIEKYFHEMNQDEKDRTLRNLIDTGIVPNAVKVSGKTYSLNITNWNTLGVISYGTVAAVNAENQNTNHPNYKDGQWRYLGYDMNGGLYGNDDFPPDFPGGGPPENKNWLTTTAIKNDLSARNLIGNSTIKASDRIGMDEKTETASLFLSKNPEWASKGWTEDKIVEHFFFNAVVSHNGLTQGQFVGVHSIGAGIIRYQTFSVQTKVKFEVPPPKPVDPDPEPDPDPILPPEEDDDISVDCDLWLPSYTYETHTVLAEDNSCFTVNGESYRPSYIYSEKLATNSFKTIGGSGSARKIKDTTAEVSFKNTGFHHVELTVKPKGGAQANDIKPIEVRRTPAIIDSLGGTQKQNRRQTISLNIAKRTDCSLDEVRIKIEYLDRDDSVTLYHNVKKPYENELNNSDYIKTRPIKALLPPGKEEEYVSCELDFLMKNTEDANCRYTVFVRDSRGDTDTVVRDFIVSPDRPPLADMNLDGAYVRNANSNVAEITVEDISSTDGDQIERSWFYREIEKGQTGTGAEKGEWIPIDKTSPGYADYAFGTGKKIGFFKTGVGPFEVRLVAKDLWTEETLPEYVDDADRLSSEIVEASEVTNIAPNVDLKPISTRTANIAILTGPDEEYDIVMKNKGRLEADLMQHGIAADFNVEKMVPPSSEPGADAAVKTLELKTPYGHEGHWTFYEYYNFIVDNERFYKLDASWPSMDVQGYPESPYTISCWEFDASGTDDTRWTYTFTDDLFPIGRVREGPYFSQDDSEKYLYFVANGKTLIVTKDNGSFLTVLDMEVGRNCYVEGNNIFTLKSDGIYSISALTGEVKKIYNGSVMNGQSRRLDGKIHFITGSGKTMYRGIFDPVSMRVALEPLQFATDAGIPSHELIGIDIEGKLIVKTTTQEVSQTTGNTTGNRSMRVRVYKRNNNLVFTGPKHTLGNHVAKPVYDEGGVCNYIAYTWGNKSGSSYYNYALIYDIESGYNKQTSISGTKDNPPTNSNEMIFVREIDDKVYICNGAVFAYLSGYSYRFYSERVKTFVFEPKDDTVKGGDYYGEVGINLVTPECGQASDVLAVLQSGYNDPQASYSLNFILKWDQSLRQVLNRHIAKNLKTDKDINLLIVFDETNPSDLYTADLIAEINGKTDSRNAKFIKASRTDILGDELFDIILDAKDMEKNILGVSVDVDSGSMSKSFKLEPNKVYHYEYEIKGDSKPTEDLLTVKHRTARTKDAQFSNEGYYTAESFIEDFEDASNINPFFTLDNSVIDNGYYKGATEANGNKESSYKTAPKPANKTAITFTVPEDRMGFLSLDYFIDKKNEPDGGMYWTQSYISIDGKMWDAFAPTAGKGHYSHRKLLEPGEHAVTFFTSVYNRDETGKMWLDKIRVDLLQETSANVPVIAEKDNVSINPSDDEYNLVQGSFNALPPIPYYSKVENAEIIDGPIGETNYVEGHIIKTNKKEVNYVIPEGKTAICTFLPTQTRPNYTSGRNRSVGYTLPIYSYGEDGRRSKLGSHSWTSSKLEYLSNAFAAMHTFPIDGTIVTGPYISDMEFTISESSYYGTSGKFTRITSVIVDSENDWWQDLDYFLRGDGSDMNYILEREKYDGVTMTFDFPKGQHLIRNFRLYYIHKGVKVYAEKEAFSDSAVLSKWEQENVAAAIIKDAAVGKEDEDKNTLVYRKGEHVAYSISYYDYEGDPSKRQYWKYTHTPFNDGPHPDAAVITDDDGNPMTITGNVLDRPINKFYIDGKYIVEHWQEDNTTRPVVSEGNPDYDKLSNVVSLTFYVEGGGSAPWIESIKTSPTTVKEGDSYRLQIAVDDDEKNTLDLTTELYKDGRLIYVHRKSDIMPDSAKRYPLVLTDIVSEKAAVGNYEVICTVRSKSGVGLGNYRFAVASEGKITGMVYHTDEWDRNRKKYNLKFFGQEFNKKISLSEYLAIKAPRKRGTNVFWSGERFVLTANVGGNPSKVTAEIKGYPTYKTTLSKTGSWNSSDEIVYKGELWDKNMINKWGRNKPLELTFIFRAEYSGGMAKTFEEKVIVDSNTDYWLLHRLW
ncbi:MAG TPA: hypothetical protein VFC96_02730 [Anaerovoracaceae bacterium]|nr:hypothetical protein [Anaerovoracaceae bacterium]